MVDLAAVPGRVSLLFSRTFFSLQRPWATTALAGVNLVVNAALALRSTRPFEIAGIVLGTVVGTIVMCVAQGWILRGELGGHRGPAARVERRCAMLVAAALLGAAAYGAWYGLDELLGRSLAAQVVSRGLAGSLAGGLASTRPASGCCGCRRRDQIRRLLVSRGRSEG